MANPAGFVGNSMLSHVTAVETVAQRGIGGHKSLGHAIYDVICCHSDGLCHHGNPLSHMGNSMHRVPHVTQRVETVAQRGIARVNNRLGNKTMDKT